MVFIRKEVIEGRVYYQYVKGYRKGRRGIEVRAISNLFKSSSLQAALNGAKAMAREEKIRRAGSPEKDRLSQEVLDDQILKGGGSWHLSGKE